MKEKYLLLRVDGTTQEVSLPEHSGDWLIAVYDLIKCDTIGICDTVISKDIVMIVDDNASCQEGWEDRVNFLASYCYPGFRYRCPIVGNVIFAYRDGSELYPLPEEHMCFVKGIFEGEDLL
jgi:hypothetical protein